jgi:hypothetical protein
MDGVVAVVTVTLNLFVVDLCFINCDARCGSVTVCFRSFLLSGRAVSFLMFLNEKSKKVVGNPFDALSSQQDSRQLR